MADLSDLNSSQSVKIAGAGPTTGVETNYLDIDSTGRPTVKVTDTAGSSITIGQKTMVNSIPVTIASDQTLIIQSTPLPASGSGFVFGEVTTAAISTLAVVEKTIYTEQTVNAQRSIASASANDTAVGTGARTVIITYLDQTMAGPFTETLTLNGTTGVNTVNTNICFIESIKVVTAGSGGANAGIITLYSAINKGGSVIGTIALGDNTTFWSHHYVPSSKICYISGFSVNNNSTAVGNGASFTLRARNPLVVTSVNTQISDTHRLYGQSSTANRLYNSPIQIQGPALIRVYVSPESNTSIVQRASFDFIDN